MADMEFARRLKQACDDAPHIPSFGMGQQKILANTLKVSPEASRRWFNGVKPRKDKMKKLAKYLKVDEVWLAMGISSSVTKAEKGELIAASTGATNVVYGLFTKSGNNCFLPDEQDPRKDIVDFFVIIDGVQYPITVEIAKSEKDTLVVNIRRDFESSKVVVYVQGKGFAFKLYYLPTELIERHKKTKGDQWEVKIDQPSCLKKWSLNSIASVKSKLI